MRNKLEFDSLELSFSDKRILSGIYMRCETGEVVGLLGRNGTGKSCLMKIVFGSLEAENKHIRINDLALRQGYLADRVIAFLPQENLIPPYLTIRKAFLLFKVDLSVVNEFFPTYVDMLDFKPSQISGGTVRLLEALMILKSKAKFCILDEPFSGLSPVNVETLIGLINNARNEKGIIITDHLHKHVTSISNRLYLLSNGKTYEIKQREQLVSMGYLSEIDQ
jgi:ABC-type multidrug transport system ATPase subunit